MTLACPACGSRVWCSLLTIPRPRSLTTDLRRLERPLDKVMCRTCGLARNAELRGAATIREYEDAYELNVAAGEEHIYFTRNGPITRSQAVFDWIAGQSRGLPDRILEIGCGQGNLLVKLRQALPQATVCGLEASHRAVALGRAKGLDVVQGVVGVTALPPADLVISFGVLEHVEEPLSFLTELRRASRRDMQMLLAVPVQEEEGYDLFFADHVWHFTLDHLRAIVERAGWQVEHAERSHPVVQGFGLLSCRPGAPAVPGPIADAHSLQARNRDIWIARLGEADRRLAALGDRPFAVFGSGELFALLHTYGDLGRCRVDALIDDAPNRQGRVMYGIPVHDRDWLSAHTGHPVFVAVNARYHGQLAESLSQAGRVPVFWC